jgi:hypothetical protein
MPQYEVVVSELSGTELVKRTNDDGTESWIPADPANSDYQAYLNRNNPDWGKPHTPLGVNE